MPLVKNTLKTELEKAFSDAMKEFIRVATQGGNVDSQAKAIAASSDKFGTEASTAIDSYIKSATVKAITIPPGQTVATAGSPAAQVGTTTAPVQSLPLPSGLE
jgi:hypothetical protein